MLKVIKKDNELKVSFFHNFALKSTKMALKSIKKNWIVIIL